MLHGYSATPLWGLNRNSAVAGIFRENVLATYSAHQCLALNRVSPNREDPMREIHRFANLGHNLCENDKQTLQDYI